MEQPALPQLSSLFLRILIVLNRLSGVAILALLIATIVARDWTFTALGIDDASGIPGMITGLRVIAVLGLVGVVLSDAVLRRLLAIVQTVSVGNPFVRANAHRLHEAAWALLALQVLGIIIGFVGDATETPAHPLDIDGGASLAGWLAVLLTFVLARVFASGTALRDDLAGVV